MAEVYIPSDVPTLEGSVRSRAYAFLDKLRHDDKSPGLHIEPIVGSADSRARTGRVNDFWRAVLIKLSETQAGACYVYLGTFAHDDAIKYAKTVRLKRNPHSSVSEIVRVAMPADPVPADAIMPPPSGHGASPSAETPASERPLLQTFGITEGDLLRLGIHRDTAEAAIRAIDDSDLLSAAMDAIAPWQESALLDLADGKPLEHVRITYRVAAVPGGTDHDTDDDLRAGLQHPAARMGFATVEDESMLRAVLDGDFAKWRVFLHPEQRGHAHTRTSGAFRLSGGAGTGKTVILLHRARALYRANPDARIVLTTFNRTLAASLRENLRLLDPGISFAKSPGEVGVYVGTVDSVSWRILQRALQAGLDVSEAVSATIGPRSGSIDQLTHRNSWRRALDTAGHELPESLRDPAFLAGEYSTVIVPHRIRTLDEYLAVRRTGRGVGLDRTRRQDLWETILAYRRAAAGTGSTDHEERAMVAAEVLNRGAADHATRRPADHVLVDEAQDLTPARLLLLRALVESGPDDLFLADDSQQRIYAPHVVLSHWGIRIRGRSQRLTLNYRTTAQNLGYATGVLVGDELIDLEDSLTENTPMRSARTGPPPSASGYDSLAAAHAAAADRLRSWLDAGCRPETIAVLVRSGNEGTALVGELTSHGIPARHIGSKDTPGSGHVLVMTMHRAKGMEFRNVLLFGITADSSSPFLSGVPDGDKPDAIQRERNLLYVACTRARDELAVMWDGRPSDLLPEAI